MIKGALAVYYRELMLMRRKGGLLFAGMTISPLLYFLTFGQGIGRSVQWGGVPYASFLLPGLVAMGSMMHAYSMASEINIARFYFRIFDEFQASPVGPVSYVLGEVLAGITRGMTAAIIVVLLGMAFGVQIHHGAVLWLTVILNSFFFASLAVSLAMIVRTHQNQAMLSNFIITPMAFLGGTFFPVDSMPGWAQVLLNILPLTQASHAIRAACLGYPSEFGRIIVMAILGSGVFLLAVRLTDKVQD
jgi:ABC-type multidrug transport system permease subunit